MTILEGGKRSTAQNLSCALSVIGLGLAFAGLVVSTGGVGLYIAAAGYIVAPASAGLSCFA